MTGEALSPDFCTTVTNMMRMGHSSADYDKEHNTAIPANCEGLRPVKVNPEVWNVLNEDARRVDLMLQKAHKQLQRGAAALSQVGDILKAHYPDNQDAPMQVAPDQRENMIQGVFDGLQALGHGNAELAHIRRQMLKPSMAPDMRKLCGQSQAFTESLFGDDIAKDVDSVEVSKKIEGKLAKDSKKPSTFNKQKQPSKSWWNNRNQGYGQRSTPYGSKQGGYDNARSQYGNYRGDRKNQGGNGGNNWQAKSKKGDFLGKRQHQRKPYNN
jgi:hypothetical protein